MDGIHLSFAGAGRVATALCRRLLKTGYSIDLIVSRTEKTGKELASSVFAAWSDKLIFPKSTDIVIVAVPDHSLGSVLENLVCGENTIVAHTAGSFGLDVFPAGIKNKGVFYPLQTFSAGREINFREVPFLLEADEETTRRALHQLASSLSVKIDFVSKEQRRMIHLAAVFACNFTNHMLTAGYDIVTHAGIRSDILEPLIRETVSKAIESGPYGSQTGPAFRNDTNTIEKHLELLSLTPGFSQLYESVTSSIIEYYKNKKSDQF